MDSRIEHRIREVISSNFGPVGIEPQIRLIDDVYDVRLIGLAEGASPKYAWRRRRRVERELFRISEVTNVPISLEFGIDDAVSRLKDAILAQLRSVVHKGCESVEIELIAESEVRASAFIRDHLEPEKSSSVDDAKKTIRHLLHPLGLRLRELTLVGPTTDLPTGSAILRAIKVNAPAKLPIIERYLSTKQYRTAGAKSLAHQLDRLRQKGLLKRLADGAYVVTGTGLNALGGVPGRNNADVERVLLLRRGRWYHTHGAAENESR